MVIPPGIKRVTGVLAHWFLFFPYLMWRSRNAGVVIPYLQGLLDAMRGRLGPWASHMRDEGRTLDGHKIRMGNGWS
jgi:hypothetical protein